MHRKLIKLEKPDFLGRRAYLAIKDNQPRERLVCLEVEASNADASGGEPIFLKDGTPVGRVSSGAYGYSVQKSLALGFIKSEYLESHREFDVAILGLPTRATLLSQPLFDPKGQKLRS